MAQTDISIDFKAEAEALRDELIARRRDFHQYPELAYEEVRTSGIIAAELNELGLEVQTGLAKTGVVAILEGAEDGPTVLYRADMDALPVTELADLPYKSQIDGAMHACGHDAHTAMLVGAARLLAARRDELPGRVRFMFQPGEEGSGGAAIMIDDGVKAQGVEEDEVKVADISMHILEALERSEADATITPIV